MDFLSKNAAIAAALGASIVKVQDNGYSVVALDGAHLALSYNGWRKAGRLSVSVAWPRFADGQACYFGMVRDHYDDVEPSISVSLDKSPDKIAADIKRRFLSIAGALYAKALARVSSADDHAAKVAANYAALAAACGGSVSSYNGNNKTIRGEPSGVDVKYVGADKVTLVLDLSVADACAMLAKAAKAAKGAA